MRTSTTRYALLGMLNNSPKTGYEIKKAIESSIVYFWSEEYGQIYPMLRRLVEEELATFAVHPQERRPNRVVYAITDKGRRELRAWLEETAHDQPPRNELLLKMFFSADAPVSGIIDQIRKFEERVKLSLAELHEVGVSIPRREGRAGMLHRLTLKYGQMVNEARLTWVQEALRTLAEESEAEPTS